MSLAIQQIGTAYKQYNISKANKDSVNPSFKHSQANNREPSTLRSIPGFSLIVAIILAAVYLGFRAHQG